MKTTIVAEDDNFMSEIKAIKAIKQLEDGEEDDEMMHNLFHRITFQDFVSLSLYLYSAFVTRYFAMLRVF